ncbi:transmembrane protein [Macrolepiota fuliginosa MF-IS2]|uniref:ER membrane protein complex subunit 3 n=1 Tax=Macrolepiota fuliginosa MF-IS2 TaxID=1400762 RepID=A0A9P5XL46_9AGAR|nr:transmembrane protein [Macrolepiota fuliginosa MF-IS2]
MSTAASLYLDPSIRDWVLFPISLVMVLVGILRHYVLLLLQNKPKPQTRAQIREQRALTRSQLIRATSAHSPLAPPFYHTISQNLKQAFTDGIYLKDGLPVPKKPKEGGDEAEFPKPPSFFSDPGQMDTMMSQFKTQTVVMIPQMVIMGWVNFFFSGFVAIKLPFPLTLGFKPMMQRGISTPDMDTRWVSSLSWYFLNFFGLNGVYRLLLGNEDTGVDLQQMASGMPNMSAAPAVPQDYNKLFKQEKENLDFDAGFYNWIGEDVESRVLRKYGKIPPADS